MRRRWRGGQWGIGVGRGRQEGGNGELEETGRGRLEGGDGEGATERGRWEGGKGEGEKKGQEEGAFYRWI